MKTITILLAGVLLAPAAAMAACQQYEFSELKAMKRNDLEFAYCISVLESRKAQIHADTADKLESLNSQRYQPDIATSIANNRAAGQATNEGAQCDATIAKLERQIEARHLSVAKVRTGCHLD
ncbi:hypothetical protein SAMN05443245_3401 [Paraburkholderia fungorum]|uniref:Lysozyme inhibitor LprI N-terminal domain-containing protein n=1 Tax=Paraburkholderia fungorum TaxID=134537 RepID=A0A1H1GZE3_9BURK|nr:hypothetical protein [Paraburkholderia fungorum]SDR18554.1 hypothetical protein SAMN05443245_3401 [Paraburkholderia fungorum]